MISSGEQSDWQLALPQASSFCTQKGHLSTQVRLELAGQPRYIKRSDFPTMAVKAV